MTINTKAFKTYDIRGLYPQDVNEDIAYKLGKAYVKFLDIKSVVIGQDARTSSPSLFESLSKGITDAGANVVNIGMCTTPMLNYSVAINVADAGIMISASHNPAQYNAFKLIKEGPLQVHSDDIQKLKKMVEQDNISEVQVKGMTQDYNILPKYLEHALKAYQPKKQLKIVVDYGNGVGSISAKPFLEKTEHSIISMYDEPDGTYPNHEANPHDLDNFKEIQAKIKEENADVGVFFDGDADRAIFLDDKGEIIDPDILVCFLAKNYLPKSSEKDIYFDLRFSKAATDVIKECGGKPDIMRVGNPFYKEALKERGGLFAAEFSGHFMFNDNYNIDDGLFLVIKVLNIMDQPLSQVMTEFKKYATSPEINIKVEDADLVFSKVKEHFIDKTPTELDGLTYEFGDWWFNIRKSNTEPLVRIRVEANKTELLEEKIKLLKDLLL